MHMDKKKHKMWENVDFPYQKRNREKGTSKGV